MVIKPRSSFIFRDFFTMLVLYSAMGFGLSFFVKDSFYIMIMILTLSVFHSINFVRHYFIKGTFIYESNGMIHYTLGFITRVNINKNKYTRFQIEEINNVTRIVGIKKRDFRKAIVVSDFFDQDINEIFKQYFS